MLKTRKEGIRAGTNGWMTTYTDLMILLLTFFVLLLSVSVLDQKKRRLAINSLVGAFGFKPGGQAMLGEPQGLNITIGTAPMEKEDILFEKLRNVALKSTVEPEMEIIKENERLVIILSDQVLFAFNSDNINSQHHPYLRNLASVLAEEAELIELRGYIDPSEIVFDPDQSRKAMFLSTKRALAVFQFFHKEGQIPVKNMVAHGFGVHKPPAGSKAGQSQLNRQVEIILDIRDKVPHRLKKQERSGSWLDFKGFLFRYPGDRHE